METLEKLGKICCDMDWIPTSARLREGLVMDQGELHPELGARADIHEGMLGEVQVAIKVIRTNKSILQNVKQVSRHSWEYTSNLLMNTIYRFSLNGHRCGRSYITRTS